jgi:hypothetical protein
MSQKFRRRWNSWEWFASHFIPVTGIPAMIGTATMVAATAALALTTLGYYRGPCYSGSACGVIPYSVFTAPEVLAMFALSTLPLLVALDSRPASRVLGVIGASGVVVLGWTSVFFWGARFTYGNQLVFLNGDADTPFLVIWLLGTLIAGAAIAVFGCLRRLRASRAVETIVRSQSAPH